MWCVAGEGDGTSNAKRDACFLPPAPPVQVNDVSSKENIFLWLQIFQEKKSKFTHHMKQAPVDGLSLYIPLPTPLEMATARGPHVTLTPVRPFPFLTSCVLRL